MNLRPWRLGAALIVAPPLLTVTFLGRAAQNAGQTTYPLIGRDLLHMSSFAVGALVAAAGVANVLCSTVLIGWARRWPPAVLLAAGQALALVGFVLLSVPSGPLALWFGAVGLGAAAGLVFPSLMTMIATASPGQRARALAVMSLALSASLVTGPLVEAGLLGILDNSLHVALAAMIAFPLGAVAVATRLAWQARAQPSVSGGRGSLAQEHLRSTGPGGHGRTFRLALTVMLTYQVPFAALIAFGALLAGSADGLSASDAEAAFAVFFAASAAVRLVLAIVPPGRHMGRILAGSASLTMIGVGGLGLGSTFWELVAAMAVLGIPHGTTFPLASSILAEFGHADERELVRANGRLMAGANGASILVPLVFGWLASELGYRAMFALVEVPVVLASILLVFQLASHRSPLRQPVLRGSNQMAC